MSSPQRVSNSDFQAGGIYPGGSGVVKDISYKLWDYNGTQPPNSQTCVELLFAPTDGSNEGKDVVINWNVARSDSHAPDPSDSGFCLDLKGTGAKLSDSSNWHFAYEEGFVKNCGIAKDALDGPRGIKALIGSELTLTRMDPPKREGLAPSAPPAPGQAPRRVNQILVPTRAKWAWEKGGAARPTGSTTANTPAATASNGNGSGDLASFMLSIVTKEGGAIDMKDFTSKLTAELTLAGVKGKSRVDFLKASKIVDSIATAAAANNLLLEEFAIAADGAMSGTLSTQ